MAKRGCSHSCKKNCGKGSKRRSGKQRRSRTRRHHGGAMKPLSPGSISV
uniref:Uncharacterized protein n=1 Tax=viral metagenome TaxID=1070528 RepID=A0A6C0F6I1_9ZZZZ